LNAIFHIEGGVGKHIAFTAVIEAYKNTFPEEDIIVVCAWPDVFVGNPFIKRIYRIGGTPYFYKDYIYQKDSKVFAQDPYKQTSHILKQQHLIQTWCELVGAEYSGETPGIYLNIREKEYASHLISHIPKDKPLLLFQPFGGPGKEFQTTPYSWMRDIHPDAAQQVASTLSKDYNIIHVCYDFHPHLENVYRFDSVLNKKQLIALLLYTEKRILIDSSLQHAAAALSLPSTVAWIATQPSLFGYSIHKNITPNKLFPEGNPNSYLFDYNFTGDIHECPYTNSSEIISPEKIIESVYAKNIF
jgi:hypothetical protein